MAADTTTFYVTLSLQCKHLIDKGWQDSPYLTKRNACTMLNTFFATAVLYLRNSDIYFRISKKCVGHRIFEIFDKHMLSQLCWVHTMYASVHYNFHGSLNMIIEINTQSSLSSMINPYTAILHPSIKAIFTACSKL